MKILVDNLLNIRMTWYNQSEDIRNKFKILHKIHHKKVFMLTIT